MKKTVIIVAQNFQDEEFTYPYYRLLEEGHPVEVATPNGQDVFGKYGVPARATMATEQLDVDTVSSVILPGGFESPDRLRMRNDVKQFVKSMDQQGKLIAAICHGPWICISAGILRERKVTAYESIKDDLINAGALYVDEPVVIDRNIITSPHYRNNGDFMRAVVNYLKNNGSLN